MLISQALIYEVTFHGVQSASSTMMLLRGRRPGDFFKCCEFVVILANEFFLTALQIRGTKKFNLICLNEFEHKHSST